ncbi:hypothetical protein EDD16DRAFT_507038 [Pisolithus croceorrhizus]|nr:hypothetical protein EDD16DRAFT_507038 [Pisolithus croceorrhizus]
MQLDATLNTQAASRRKGQRTHPSSVLQPKSHRTRLIKHGVDELVASKAQFVAYCSTLEFKDAELDITRFLVSAIVPRCVSEGPSSGTGVSDLSWDHFLRLLDNELANVRDLLISEHMPSFARRFQSTFYRTYRRPRERHWERFRGLGRGSQG